jgi:predicted SAM-dependent methyltransferase
MKEKLRGFLPKFILSTYRDIRYYYRKIKFKGTNFFCNVCKSYLSKFLNYGPKEHFNFICPVCNSFGRHRMMAIVLLENLPMNQDNIKLLHFAPELGIKVYLKKRFPKINYSSSDYENSESDLNLDLLDIDLQNNSINYIILSHVLEHVEDDTKALNELKRVLIQGGKLFLQVPLSKNSNTNREKLKLDKDRLLNYGQSDHLRLYGKEDLYNQLVKLGFEVNILEAVNQKYAHKFEKMALDLPKKSKMLYSAESTTFICQKSLT